MLDKIFFAYAFKDRISFDGDRCILDGKITDIIGKDGFYPLFDICTALGLTVKCDHSCISDGMIIISDTDFELPNGIDDIKVPYVKEIGAYMMTTSPLQELNDFLFYRRPSAEKLFNDYKKSPLYGIHPRLLFDRTDFDRLRNHVKTDKKLCEFYSRLLHEADELLEKEPLKYELTDGVRLWFVANWFNGRIQVLSLSYILSGEKKYFQRAKQEMIAAANFQDWHPEHHIDTGAMAIGFAIGYDWLYHDYTDEERELFEKSVYKNGYIDYIKGYEGKSGYMAEGITFGNNHNAVMNSGAVTMAIAFADIYPEKSFYLLCGAIRAAENMLHRFARNGAWYEGVPYGTMTLNFLAYHFAAMDKVFQSNYTLDKAEGMDKAADCVINMQGPAGPYTFSDAESDGACVDTIFEPSILWFSHYYGKDCIQKTWYSLFDVPVHASELVRTVMWYNPEITDGEQSLAINADYPEYNVAVMRSGWDRNQTMVGIKGGKANVEHGHMDMGSFEYFRGDIRWIDDVGADNYDLYKFFWGFTQDDKRWGYYRERAEAHSCLVINPDRYGEYDPNETAVLSCDECSDDSAVYTVDMTKCFGENRAKKASRRFTFCDHRQSLAVCDSVLLSGNSDVYWFAYTRENVEILGNKCILTSKAHPDKKLEIEFLCSHDFELFLTPPEPIEATREYVYSKKTDGTRIVLKSKAEGEFKLTAKLTPYELEEKSNINEYYN